MQVSYEPVCRWKPRWAISYYVFLMEHLLTSTLDFTFKSSFAFCFPILLLLLVRRRNWVFQNLWLKIRYWIILASLSGVLWSDVLMIEQVILKWYTYPELLRGQIGHFFAKRIISSRNTFEITMEPRFTWELYWNL